jgi:hypothetical protein
VLAASGTFLARIVPRIASVKLPRIPLWSRFP